jgi:hypothetical protein
MFAMTLQQYQPSARVLLVRAALALIVASGPAGALADNCEPSGDDHFVCGIPSAEDLVRVPGTAWIIASDFSGPHALNLIDTVNKSWRVLAPSELFSVGDSRERFPFCPGPPEMESLVTHGLHISDSSGGHSTLYAVGHGGREAIEVFDIDASDPRRAPRASWVGCVPSPQGQEINSVTVLADGSLLATVPLEHGRNFAEAMTGINTGAVYRWSASSEAWSRLAETAQPYANGIALSDDESVFYVASSGRATITAYRNDDSARALWTTPALPIAPDNLRRDEAGRLLTAGLLLDYPACDPYNEAGEFDLAKFGACPRPYAVYSLNPQTQAATELASGPANPSFGNVTIGIVVDHNLWIGTFAGDRVAYRHIGAED